MRAPWPRFAREAAQDESQDAPDDPGLVEVEQLDGSTIWCRPEAVDHWRPEVWRNQP